MSCPLMKMVITRIEIISMYYLQQSRHCATSFAYISSCDPHNTSLQWVWLWTSFYSWEAGSKGLHYPPWSLGSLANSQDFIRPDARTDDLPLGYTTYCWITVWLGYDFTIGGCQVIFRGVIPPEPQKFIRLLLCPDHNFPLIPAISCCPTNTGVGPDACCCNKCVLETPKCIQ